MDRDYKNNSNIKWNSTKFLIDREGEVVARFEPTASLKDVKAKEVVKAYKPYLDELDLIVTITDSGEALKERTVTVPERLSACVALDPQIRWERERLKHPDLSTICKEAHKTRPPKSGLNYYSGN